jgi:hypothetical protein
MANAQIRYDGHMRWGRALCLVVGMFTACTRANEAKHCSAGTCTTPDFPFCDVTGAIGGEAGTCIAITCTAGEFGECRDDAEVRCNATGNNYDVVQCERGCDASADGCRLCNPSETACTNGKVATCDSNGTVVSSTSCALGCFEDQPRCREIDPSNALAMYFDMAPDPPDLNLENAAFNTSTGVVRDLTSNMPIVVPNFLVPATPGGAPIRVFIANAVTITSAYASSNEFAGPAFALLARGDIKIIGQLRIEPSAGGMMSSLCTGGQGRIRTNCTNSSSGGGGGAFATNGAKGGDVPNNSAPGGAGGIAAGNDKLIPLRGGCDGGGVNDDSGPVLFQRMAVGGGAAQLVSRAKITVEGNLSAVGAQGEADRDSQTNAAYLGGGGAGGGILLEAPVVELTGNGQLLATGGDGASACGGTGVNCSVAGKGARVGIAATAGTDISCLTNGLPTASGAGGGGLGRVRINTASGTYTKASSVIEEAAVTSGIIGTR